MSGYGRGISFSVTVLDGRTEHLSGTASGYCKSMIRDITLTEEQCQAIIMSPEANRMDLVAEYIDKADWPQITRLSSL